MDAPYHSTSLYLHTKLCYARLVTSDSAVQGASFQGVAPGNSLGDHSVTPSWMDGYAYTGGLIT